MHETELILNIAVALGAALLGGIAARLLRLPVILGYIVAGIAVGPSTPGFVANAETVRTLAEVGVALLMFSLGVEFSLHELNAVRRIAIFGGSLQVGLCILVGFLFGLTLGWSWQPATLLGMIVAMSSSIVALKLLLLRGDMNTRYGKTAVGMAVFQDLMVVPMFIAVPALAQDSGNFLVDVARSVGTAVAILVAVVVVGTRVTPWLFERIAATASRELFLLMVIVVALGTALATEAAGLSLALGAFLAGIVVSETDFRHQVVAEIVPLREAFATLFFVSIGMLLDITLLRDHLALALLFVVIIALVKFGVFSGVVRGFGVPAGTAVLVGVLLAQIGEFSLILAGEGLENGLLTEDRYDLILIGTIGTILITPFAVSAGPRLARAVERMAMVRAPDDLTYADGIEALQRHTIVCGYGRLGAELAGALHRRGIACAVVDDDPNAARRARGTGVTAIYGDAGNPDVLRRVGLERARALAVAISDPVAAEALVAHARRAVPRLRIVARATSWEQLHRLRDLGADEVVQPEFEAAMEVIRYVMHAHGVEDRVAGAIVQGRRQTYYEPHEGEV
jgi:CPA2 family monovalent cation:H+ antiporter-2